MHPDFGPALTTLQTSGVDFIVIGLCAAKARGAKLSASALRNMTLDLVPNDDDANLDRLAAAVNDMASPRLRMAPPRDGLPIVVDAGTFTRLPVLPLSTTLGEITVVLRPAAALSTFGSIVGDASELIINSVPVPVAGFAGLLGGLVGGEGRPDPAVLKELRRVEEAGRHLTTLPRGSALLQLELERV